MLIYGRLNAYLTSLRWGLVVDFCSMGRYVKSGESPNGGKSCYDFFSYALNRKLLEIAVRPSLYRD